MDIVLFNKAKDIQSKLEYYRKHKQELIECGILNGGSVYYSYNSHRNDVKLDQTIYGEFLKDYCYDLETKIQELEKAFNEL